MTTYRFKKFDLDTARFELRADGERIAIPPLSLKLLIIVMEARGRLVTKDEIIDSLWNGRSISEAALASQIRSVRRAVEDVGRPYEIIETVHGQGFRLICDVDIAASDLDAPQTDLEATDKVDEIAHAPRIAVLPFKLIGAAGPHAGLAEALPDEIITAISRLRWLFVVARGSSFKFPSFMTDMAIVRERLEVDYVLSGTVEVAGDQVTLNVEFADARDEQVVWAERYEVPIAGVHEIRGEIVGQIANSIDFRVPQREMERARLSVPRTLGAWEHYHVGISNVFTFGRPDYRVAQEQFEAAIRQDRHFARAHAGLSHVHWWQMVQQSDASEADAREIVLRSAENAIEAEPLDPFANLVRGRAAWLQGEPDVLGWFKRAIEFSPSYAMAYGAVANFLALSGDAKEALPYVSRAIALSPVDPWLHNMYAVYAAVHMQADEFDEAARWAEKAMALPHDSLITAQSALVAMHLAGRYNDAERIARKIKALNPSTNAKATHKSLPILAEDFKRKVEEAFSSYGLN